MSNILDDAITQTLHFGKPTTKDAFHIALTGTTDYIPHMGIVALTVHEHNKDLPSAIISLSIIFRRRKGESSKGSGFHGQPSRSSSDRRQLLQATPSL